MENNLRPKTVYSVKLKLGCVLCQFGSASTSRRDIYENHSSSWDGMEKRTAPAFSELWPNSPIKSLNSIDSRSVFLECRREKKVRK